MPREILRLGIVARSHPPATVWGGRVLRPVAVLPVPAPLAALLELPSHADELPADLGRFRTYLRGL